MNRRGSVAGSIGRCGLTLLAAGLVLSSPWLRGQAAPEPAKAPSTEAPIVLEDYTVETTAEEYDATGMGSIDDEMRDEPFANDLIAVSDYTVEGETLAMNADLAVVAEPSPAERVAGGDRLNLRGFPTPALRNSFIQVGMPETLNTAQTIIIQGPLVPVLGRAAPGGIQNFMTARPRAREQIRFGSAVTTRDRQRSSLEYTSPIVQKKFWQRLAVEWQRAGGPERFSTEETRAAYAALTWRHSRTASTLLSLDFREIRGPLSPGIPEYRVDAAHLIAGPYLPLALFNANGPSAAVRRRSAAASLQFDGQPTKRLAVRASLEGWWRSVVQDRFTQSVLDLSTGLFEGLREPRHLELPQRAAALRLEGTLRLRGWGADHKLLAGASFTRGESEREERSLPTALRDALPADLLHFNPFAPNFTLPPFSPGLYQRITADREEIAHYTSLELSDRAAWGRGRVVATAGLRFDEVELRVADRKPGALFPRLHDRTRQVSYLGGVNYQLRPGRLLAFANASTAFDPSTPIDARTGRIQEHETTLGYEAGLRGRALGARLDYSVGGFLLYNRHVARRNPLYNDPIVDADQTQPQLVAPGEERFSGIRGELKFQATPELLLDLKGTYNHALTIDSPDIPSEVGRSVARLPALTASAALRRRPANGRAGFTWSAGGQYLDHYVGRYADARRAYLAYPGYGVASAGVGYVWRRGPRQVELEAGARNAFNRDLTVSNARVGAAREFTLSTRVTY